jgi:thiamine pyrophosphate-dependent acetolactate synthase large subunit-like protein
MVVFIFGFFFFFLVFFSSDQLGELYEAEVEEFEETPDVLKQQIKRIADAIKQAKSVVVFTGAGISTAAKLVLS